MNIVLVLFDIFLMGLFSREDIVFRHHEVHLVGAMHRVMQQGELNALVCTDTLSGSHLYGMGPVEHLRGEITIIDGAVFTASVTTDTTMVVQQSKAVCAPFLGWAEIPRWSEFQLPDSVTSNKALERFLTVALPNEGRPYFFKLSGRINNALIHVLNLPPGAEIKVPGDARKGQLNMHTGSMEVDIIGFFSTMHQRIFTHHDSFLHLHMISKDRRLMGHLDELKFSPGGLNFYVPAP